MQTQNLTEHAFSQKNVFLQLEVSDPDVITELRKYPDESSREKYATGALRLGVLALRQAAGELDATTIRDAGAKMITDMEHALQCRGNDILQSITKTVTQYFDPTTGCFPQRIEALVRGDGELDKILRTHLGERNSTLAQSLTAHLGAGSPLSQLKGDIERTVATVLTEQQGRVLKEFSLDNPASALTRMVRELTTSNGVLKTELQGEVDRLAKEFSLDHPDSALSRLVQGVESARSRIHESLTLDDEASPLSRVRRELSNSVEALAKANAGFHTEVRETLAAMQATKKEAARSTRHGNTFEAELGRLLAMEANRQSDVYEAVGGSAGIVRNCKKGDFVTRLGPDSAAAGSRIVWEAKQDASYDLNRALAETAEARKNRQAQVGVFVFSTKSAPEEVQPFARYGNDIIITWDAENPDSDLLVRIAFSVARALLMRERHESAESDQAVHAIECVARSVEKQLAQLDEIRKWAETAKSSGNKIADQATRMRDDLKKDVEALDRQVNGLRMALPMAA